MEEQIALLRMIAAHPDDDTPRLVYADWLDETGDPLNHERAEFIRFDVHFHSLPLGSEARNRLREEKLGRMMPLSTAWRAELPRIDGLTWGWFERGFVEHVITHYEVIAREWERLFDAAPVVSLTLSISDEEVTACPISRFRLDFDIETRHRTLLA